MATPFGEVCPVRGGSAPAVSLTHGRAPGRRPGRDGEEKEDREVGKGGKCSGQREFGKRNGPGTSRPAAVYPCGGAAGSLAPGPWGPEGGVSGGQGIMPIGADGGP